MRFKTWRSKLHQNTPAFHFGQFSDEDEARRTAMIIAKLT
jgi:hypothetical protein